jgi:PAS domain S-box-containing protein
MNDRVIHVLLIEDNFADVVLVREKLAEAQRVGWDLPRFKIEHVNRLKAALARLDDGEFDVVLTDLDLPDSRAGDTVAALREHIPHMALVVLTGREDETLARKSVRAGVQDYLYKNEATGSLLARTLMYAIERQQVHAKLEQRVAERTRELQGANAALRAREQRLQVIFDDAPVGMTETNLEGRWVRVNQRFCEIVGYSPDELMAMNYQDITHPDDVSEDAAWDRRVLEGEVSSFSLEKRYVRKDGSVIWAHLSVTLMRDPGGAPDYFISVVRDITERKRVERVTEARLRIVAAFGEKSSRELMKMALDEIEALTGSEVGFYHLFDEDEETIVPQAWSTNTLESACQADGSGLHYPISEAGVWADSIRQGRPIIHNDYASLPHRRGMPPGHAPIVRELVLPIVRDNCVVGAFGVGNKRTDYDATDLELASALGDFSWEVVERKRGEERLRFQSHLLNTVGQAIIVTDPAGTITYWNQAAEETYGWTAEEVMGRNIVEVTPSETTREQANEIMAHVRAGKSWSGEFFVRHRDGYSFPVIVTDTPMHDEEGDLVAVIGVTTDLTERKRAERAVEESERRFRTIVNELPQFISYTDKDLVYHFVNRSYQKKFGLKPQEVLGKTLPEVIGERAFEKARRHVERVLNGKRVRYHERFDYDIAGTRDVDGVLIPDFDEEGEVLGYYAVLTDITPYIEVLETLRESQERLRLQVERLPIGHIVHDTDLRIESWNPAAERIFGYEEGEVIGKHPFDLMVPESAQQQVEGILRQAIQGDDTVHSVNENVTKDGRTVICEWHNIPLRRADGTLVGLLSMVEDVTDRKRAEARVQEALNEARRRGNEMLRLSEASQAVLISHTFEESARQIFDAARAVTGAVSGYVALLNRDGTENEVLFLEAGGMPCAVDPELPMPIRGLRARAYATGEVVYENDFMNSEWVDLMPPGHVEMRNVMFAPLTLDGQVLGVMGLANKPTDFTADDARAAKAFGDMAAIALRRAHAEEALEWRSEADRVIANLSIALLESVPVDDLSHRVLEHARRLTDSAFGYVGYMDQETGSLICPTMTREVWEGCDVEDKSIVFEAFTGLWGWVLENRRSLLTNASQDDPRSSGIPKGHLPIRSFLSAPALIGDQLVGQIALANSERDYTKQDLALVERMAAIYALTLQRQRADQEIERYASELERSNEELEQFAYVVSHDLQQPLRMVKSYLELLDRRYRDALDEKAELFVTQAMDGARRMQEMIRALLDLSRVGTQDQQFVLTDAGSIVESTLQALSWAIDESGATVSYDSLPVVVADEAQLRQVFQNLIANAIKFRRAGVSPRVHVAAERQDGEWVFSVADNGIGIPPEQLVRIFKIFQRLHTEDEYPGLGMGLALCKRIVERHGGRIWVDSRFGEGSTFRFTLPKRDPTG